MALVLVYPWTMDERGPTDKTMPRDWDADAAGVARFQAGDEAAFEALVRSREKEVYRTALRILGDPEDAMEASQETFIRVFRSLKGFRQDASFKTWVTGICINVCRTMVSSSAGRMKRRSTGLIKESRADGDELDPGIPDRAPDPSAMALGSELRQALALALMALSPEHREVIVLRDIQDLDYSQVGQILDCPAGTVKSRLSRAREALRRALEGLWP